MTIALVVLCGIVVALIGALVVQQRQRSGTDRVVERLRAELESQRDAALSAAVTHLVTVARAQLGAQADADAETLDSRNAMMDQRLDAMHGELDRVRGLVRELEQERAKVAGELSQQLRRSGEATAELAGVTQSLRDALANSRARGQWGERMAEDVLRAAGFVEGVNYVTQRAAGGGRPDVTFLLPGGRVLHMDVKFPLDNYLRVLDAGDDEMRDQAERAFLRDVRGRVKELADRGYDRTSTDALDQVLLFIPNEQVHAFVHEHDPSLLDDALAQRVVLCSPLTLFAVLAVIRQAVEAVGVAQRSGEILDALAGFAEQWQRFVAQMDRLGDRLDAARREYDGLTTTRRRQLERQLDHIDELRSDGASVLPLADRRGTQMDAG